MTISQSIAAALCVLGSLTGAAHASNINAEASFISFKVPAARFSTLKSCKPQAGTMRRTADR